MAKLTAKNVLNTAYLWNNYYEKASSGTDAQMQNKTWNAGFNNYTWFWVVLKRLGYGDYQGQPWCDGWVDCMFILTAGNNAEGYARAKKALGGFSAYTPTSAQMFKNMGSGHWIPRSGTPRPCDQIFFTDSSGCICHTGLVTKVTASTVYTIEGNTSSASGVIDNGGCTREKSYDRSYSRIAGYGRPKFESEDGSAELSGSSYAEQVYNWGIDHGYTPQAICGILGNMKQESDVNPTCLQSPTPYAAGIVQWERYDKCTGRFAYMKKYAESKGKTWKDLQCQLEFMDMELSGNDVEYGGDGYANTLLKKYAGSYAKFKALTDVEEAVRIFHDAFERSSIPNWSVRYNAANTFYEKFKNGTSSSYEISSSDRILRLGDSGEDVKKMQQLLINRGYDLGPDGADGEFGQNSYNALIEFQNYHNLEADGEYGPMSKAILEQPFNRNWLQEGDSGDEVKTLQTLLLKAGFPVGAGSMDGKFGTSTTTAVKKFQKAYKLTETGLYDAATKAKLNEVVSTIESKEETAPKPSTDGTTVYTYGMEADEIKEIQELLSTKWKYTLTPSKKFGQATLEAVVNFQTMHGLNPNGKLDKETIHKIKTEKYHKPEENLIYQYQLGMNICYNQKLDVTGKWNEETGKSAAPIKLGDTGYMVRFLQEILVTKIKQELTINSSYDNATVKAVKYVQYYYGLEETGNMDRSTWNVLLTIDYPVK